MAVTPYPFVASQVLTADQLNNIALVPVGAKTASYTLTAADASTRVQMSNASATTITVNTALFSAGQSVWLQNIGAGVCTVTAGTATVTTAGSLSMPQYGGGELYFTSASAAIFFPSGGKSVQKYITNFLAGGTYTPAAGVTYAIAYMKGGGGGSGNGTSTSGGVSSVAFAAGTVTAAGGAANNQSPLGVTGVVPAVNSGRGATGYSNYGVTGVQLGAPFATDAAEIYVGGVVTPGVGITVTVGAGGTGGSGVNGGTGYVYIEWYA